MPEQQIQEMLGPVGSQDFQVWPENWQAVEVFLASSTQWRVIAGLNGMFRQGLDYQALESTLRMMGVECNRELFDQLQVMELSAVKLLNR